MNIGIVRKSFWLSLGMLFCVAISPSFAAPDMAGESKGSSVNSTVRTDLSTREINLAGTWMFATDPNDEGLKEGWAQRDFKETVTLPGLAAGLVLSKITGSQMLLICAAVSSVA